MNVGEQLKLLKYLPFTTEQRAKKVVDLNYLRLFLNCYNKSVTLIDVLNYSFQIIEVEQKQRGIVFVSVQKLMIEDDSWFLMLKNEIELFNKRAFVDDFWIIIKDEKKTSFLRIEKLISNMGLKEIFTAIYFFDVIDKQIKSLT
ncbi:hypothetical protein DI487_01380 [Flavobacterium sediminis]|uniref:Uncharacterized protein n=1 Tax=Flavobacterium sediminis TaxID=2201181 RepID=A0A2U8QR90_9FLAO|nr:hypothetical protein [Flavobacterium sediminis]AWM12652.1 hypothetical protein DI487_01380 [Flavobacterium sediminis]